jgi:uncharacterized membrane protein required for colicin V production
MKLHPFVRLTNLIGSIATPIFFAGIILGVLKYYMPPSQTEAIIGRIALACGIYILVHLILMVVAFLVSKPIN